MLSLSEKQQQFIAHRLAGMSIEEAAKASGTTARNAYRWMNLQTVQDALKGVEHAVQDRIGQTAYEIIASTYTKALPAACNVVVSIAEDTKAPAAARLKAVQMIQDRLAPLQAPTEQPSAEQAVDASLLGYMTTEEIDMIERIVALATERKREAEEKIIPMRRA